MVKLVLRLAGMTEQNDNIPHTHSKVGTLAGIIGIVCNLLLFILKVLVGILSGAVSVIADALNNLSDAASSVVTLLGFRLAQRPADPDHPYGHARYEYLSGLMVAVMILVIGVELVKSSFGKIFAPSGISFNAVSVVILLGSVGMKLWMSCFYATLGKKIGSAALKATAVDCRNDVIASLAVLTGCVVQWLFQLQLDGYIGLAVAGFIIYSGIGVAKKTISPLLGQRADQKLIDELNQLVLSHEKVLGTHDLLVHDYGPGRCYASVHVELSAQEDPLVCHDIIDHIECEALEMLNVNLVIHYDPVLENDEEWTRMRQTVQELITQLDPSYSMHDFRLVRGANHTKLVFDLSLPYGISVDAKKMKEYFDEQLERRQLDYSTVIRFDKQE